MRSRQQYAVGCVAGDVGYEHTVGAEHAGDGRNEYLVDAQGVGQFTCVQRSRAAKGHEGEAARVVSLLNRDTAQRAFHGGVGPAIIGLA